MPGLVVDRASALRRVLPVGAEYAGNGRTHFRVWAPASSSVDVVFDDGRGVSLDAERDWLIELSRRLRQRMRASGFDTGRSDSHIIPLVLGSNEAALRLAAAMNAAGFAVPAIRPPTVPPGTARLRISLNARLSMADLDAFAEALTAARDKGVLRE